MSSPSSPRAIFRPAALQARHSQNFGHIVLARPISFAALTLLALLCAAVVLAFLSLGHYTKRVRVQGLLVPDVGLIKVATPVAGVVVEQYVQEGQVVLAGQVLFVLSTERQLTRADGATMAASAALEESLHKREQSLNNERGKQELLTEQQREQTRARMQALHREGVQLDQQLATQRERVASSLAQLHRWEGLSEQKFASELALQQRRDEWLDQRSRLQALEQSRMQAERDEASLASDLAQLGTRTARDQEQLKRAADEIEQTRIQLRTDGRIVVTAPVSGTATSILVERGQMASASTLLSIVPQNAQLQAQLYAPSRAAGFVEAGQTVRLRYAGYPYQKFGQYEGRVLHVSRSPLTSQELPAALANLGLQFGGEGLYRITVRLADQGVNAYGKSQPLSAGMQLEADVLQDSRRVLEWMFEPALGLKDKL